MIISAAAASNFPNADDEYTPAQRRALKEARVRVGRAHAALVFDDGRCVGWCQYGPTADMFIEAIYKNLSEKKK